MNDIAKDLCAFFRQESVLVTESTKQAYFVSEKLDATANVIAVTIKNSLRKSERG